MRTLLLSVLLAAGCSPAPRLPAWPEPSEVERVTASVAGWPTDGPDLAEFEVPADDVPVVIRAFGRPQPLRSPDAEFRRETGRLRVDCKDGRSLDVRLFGIDKSTILFTLDGVPCTRDGEYRDLAPGFDKYLAESPALAAFLWAVHAGNRQEARRCSGLLARSAGRAE